MLRAERTFHISTQTVLSLNNANKQNKSAFATGILYQTPHKNLCMTSKINRLINESYAN